MTQYSGVFSLQQQGQALTSGQWCTDPYYKNTTLLLHADGVGNGTQNNLFLDSSTNGFAITRNGNTTQGSFTPYGPTWSNYFDGSSYLNLTTNAGLGLGTGTYTVECWVYASSAPAYSSFLQIDTSGLQFGLDPSGYISIAQQNVAFVVSSSTTLPLNTWNHVAVSRDGSNITRIFLNGTQIASATDTTNFATGTTAYINRNSGNSAKITGYISNLRVLKGTALYTSAFTPPTEPLTAITNTSLLTCQSNRFIDNSSNAFAITANSSPSVQRFSPFAPQYQYTPAVIGGSGYFDGSGDYLNFSPSTSFAFGTGDFTIEFWMNTAGSSASGAILDSSTNGSYWAIRFTGTTIYYQSASGLTNLLTGTVSTANQSAWTHIVISRVSATTKIFANGTQIASGADSTNYTATTTYRVGLSSDSAYYTGYISDIRVVKGSGVTSVTVPTTPLTAITNTSLLLSMTNAGIYDNAMMNNLETVGDAQVSTAVVKYGSGSLAFDGSGDYLLSDYGSATSPQEVFGTGDFTLECWVRFNSAPSSQNTLLSNYQSTSSGWTLSAESSVIKFRALGDPVVVSGATTLVANVWYHVAISRSGTSIKVFLNGVQDGSATNSDNITANSTQLNIGRLANGSGYLNGYIDDLRITKGVARYTANFQPPKVAFANQ